MSTWAVIPAKPLVMAKTRLAPALAPAARAALARALFLRTVSATRACPALAGVIVVSADAELRALAVDLGARAYEDLPHPQPLSLPVGEGSRLIVAHQPVERLGVARRPVERAGVNIPAKGDLVYTEDASPSPAGRERRAGPSAAAEGPGSHGSGGEGSGGEGSGGEGSLNRAVALGCRRAAALGADAALVLPADLPLLTPEAIARFLSAVGDAAVGVAPDRADMGTNALLLRPPSVLAPAFGPDSFLRHRELARSHGLSLATVHVPELALDLDTPADLAREHGYITTDVEAACV